MQGFIAKRLPEIHRPECPILGITATAVTISKLSVRAHDDFVVPTTRALIVIHLHTLFAGLSSLRFTLGMFSTVTKMCMRLKLGFFLPRSTSDKLSA